MIPGSNILAQALTVIAPSTFDYYVFQSRTTNAIGLDVDTYASPISMRGSIQPVARSLYEQYGLNFQKNYIWVYIQKNVLDIDRDQSGDQIKFNNQYYQALSDTRWFPIDGWTATIFVQVPNAG